MLYSTCKVKMLYKRQKMKIAENIYLGKLYDAYGALLSPSQMQVMDKFINDDLTVSEIAEILGISRQGVKDSLSKAENKLKGFEEKLSFVKKLEALEEENDRLKQKLSRR